MTRRIFLALAAGACGLLAQDALPKAETVLDRYIEVTGGKSAYEKRKTQTLNGTIEFVGRGIKGSLSIIAAEPASVRTVMDLEGIGKIESGVSSGVSWELSPIMGPRVKDGPEKADSLREATFNSPLHWRKLYPKVETAGAETINGEECIKIVATPDDGKPQTMFFSKKSGLLVKRAQTIVSPMGEIPAEEFTSDYKDFNGVLMPTKVTQKAAGQELLVTMQSVRTNEEVPKQKLEPPAEIKALLNKK
jgi:hypothetical protein